MVLAGLPRCWSGRDGRSCTKRCCREIQSGLGGPPDRSPLRPLDLSDHLSHERVEVAAWKEKAWQSERLAGLDVPGLISDHEAPVELHGPVLDEIAQHAGCGLTPRMFLDVAGDRSLRMVRTEADVIDPRTFAGELVAYPAVQRVHISFGVEAAGDAGLVGEDKHQIAGLIETADGLGDVGHPTDAVSRADIAIVIVDDAVAIEECGGHHAAAVWGHRRALTGMRCNLVT